MTTNSVWNSVLEDPIDDESTLDQVAMLIFLLIELCIGILALFWETKPHTLWTIWTPMSSVPKKADKLNLSLIP